MSPQTEGATIRHGDQNHARHAALTFEFAGSRYLFAGLTTSQATVVRHRFAAMLCNTPTRADVRIDILQTTAQGLLERPHGPKLYPLTVDYRPTHLEVNGLGFSATLDRSLRRAEMRTCLNDDWFLGAFENLLRIVVSYRLFAAGALVLHSAAFTDGALCFLACGRSGAGKTTISRIAEQNGLVVLSDELNALVPLPGGTYGVLALPFAGDFGGIPKTHAPYPLTALLGLEQSLTPALTSRSKAEQVSRMVASCPYLNADPMLSAKLYERALELTEVVAFRVLAFAKDPSFWSVLTDEYPRSTI